MNSFYKKEKKKGRERKEMSLRITCKAGDLKAYMRLLISTYGKDCLVINLKPIVTRKEVSVNGAALRN